MIIDVQFEEKQYPEIKKESKNCKFFWTGVALGFNLVIVISAILIVSFTFPLINTYWIHDLENVIITPNITEPEIEPIDDEKVNNTNVSDYFPY